MPSYVIFGLPDDVDFLEPDETPPRMALGRREDVVAGLARMNTAPEVPGDATLHGPGFLLRLVMRDDGDTVDSVAMQVNDDSIHWPVLQRLARDMHWCVHDPDSNRYLVLRRHPIVGEW